MTGTRRRRSFSTWTAASARHTETRKERPSTVYNHRGKAEQYIKEGKYAIKWTRLSCGKFGVPSACACNNAVRLQLHALAYNLGNFMRTLALPKEVEHWSLTTLLENW